MPHTLPIPLTESPRRTPEEARTVLLAIAKRSPHLLDVATVDMLLSNVSHVGAMLCALGSNFVQVLLGHLAGVYFEAGKESMGPARFFDLATALRDVFVRMEAAVAHDATMTGVGNVQRSWEALKAEMLRQEQINTPVRSEGQRWDEGECAPIRDIRTAMEMPRTVDIEQVKL